MTGIRLPSLTQKITVQNYTHTLVNTMWSTLEDHTIPKSISLLSIFVSKAEWMLSLLIPSLTNGKVAVVYWIPTAIWPAIHSPIGVNLLQDTMLSFKQSFNLLVTSLVP